MERSSPLAAMQAPSLHFGDWGFRTDASMSNSHYTGKLCFGPSSFNFKDLSMVKPAPDYFSLRPVRGSSPTASLAADLSQNFHIDQSPQLATPRRSLFSTNLFGTVNGREIVTTPPIPSSSPAPGNDSMEISPLPHKAPYAVASRVEARSPSPEKTTANTLLASPVITSQVEVEVPIQTVPLERTRRTTLLRPSLSRTKGLSTNTLSFKANGTQNQLPAFQFGNGPSTSNMASMSLDECFVSSPQQEKKLPQIPVMGPPRPKQPFASVLGHSRSNGSPIIGHIRKPSAPLQRPRKQFRRSLSMFEHPAEVTKQDKPCCTTESLQSIMDVDDAHQPRLPHFIQEEESLPRITKNTMINVLDGKYSEFYDRSVVIDCRFEYEYNGGHIDGAINYNDKEELAGKLFEAMSPSRILLIFHCEYSAHRAPIMAKFVRHRDRAMNAHQYPKLTYPEVYILDGGYSSFYMDHRMRCFPQNYVEMGAKEHANACERGLGRIKQQRAKLSRAKTFAFGQCSPAADDSPTASNRQCSDLMMGLDISVDPHLEARRFHARRMASY